MERLYFPLLTFQPGENITVRLGKEWQERFDAGENHAEIVQIGSEEVFGIAEVSQVTCMPFSMLPQAWIEQAQYAGAQNTDDVYGLLAQAYDQQFDSEMLVSVIFFEVKEA